MAKINVTDLPEFRLMFGDPRPVFFNYILSLANTETFAWLPLTSTSKIAMADVVSFVCSGKGKGARRDYEMPKHTQGFIDTFKKGTQPFLLIPIMIKSKTRCKTPNTARHFVFLMYNRNTHEIERIDIKRYHLGGFGPKIFYERLEGVIDLLRKHDPKLTLIPDLDAPLQFLKAFGTYDIESVYPAFMTAYVSMRVRKPNLTSGRIISLLKRPNMKKVDAFWDAYMLYRSQAQMQSIDETGGCKDNQVRNLETSKCILTSAKTMQKLLPPQSKCTGNMVYNPIRRRCTSPVDLSDVNILMDSMVNVRYNDRKKYTQIAGPATTIPSVLFMMSKHPHAHLVFSEKFTHSKDINQRECMLNWRRDRVSKLFQLTVPSGFWESWRKGLYDHSIRFLIVLIKLNYYGQGGTTHAEALLYDKTTHELERFDPLGRDLSEKYQTESLDKDLVNMFTDSPHIKKGLKYFTPLDFCPKMAIFQSKEIEQLKGYDTRGNCAVWRLWYIDVRLSNPNIHRKDLVILAMEKLNKIGRFYKYLKAYQTFISKNLKQKN